MKKLFILLCVLVPFHAFAGEQNTSLEERVFKLETKVGDMNDTYESTWQKTKKAFDYYEILIALFLVLGWVLSYFWIQFLSVKDKLNDKIEKLNSDIQTNALLVEVEKFRISCKNFLSLNNGDGKSSVFLDFDPYIAQVWRSLHEMYENLKRGNDINTYLLVEDLLAIGDANYQNKDFDTALSFYTLALAKSKFNPQIHYNLAFSYLEKRLKFDKTSDENKETEYFKKAVHYGEFDFRNFVWLAISLANPHQGDVGKAEAAIKDNLDRAIELDGNLAKNMIKQYYSQGYFDHCKNLVSRYI